MLKRRGLLTGLAVLAAPAIVRGGVLMPVRRPLIRQTRNFGIYAEMSSFPLCNADQVAERILRAAATHEGGGWDVESRAYLAPYEVRYYFRKDVYTRA